MHLIRRATASLCALACAVAVGSARAQSPSADAFLGTPLFARMVQVNRGLHSYRAHVHLDAAMTSFPYLHPVLDGTAYYKEPDRNAIRFDSVPAIASLFKNVFPRLPSPRRWPRLYRMSLLGDQDGVTTIRLVPRKEGRVERLDVTVSDETAVPTGYSFAYRDGGSVHFVQRVVSRDGFYLVEGLDGKIDLPSFKADATASFSGYRPNIPVSEEQVDGAK
jgi:hypothetical protein